jgi:lysozyme family protein
MSFDAMYKYTKQFEGGWVNDLDDSGGETFRGISRVSFPKWEGWPLVDAVKHTAATARVINRHFENDEQMAAMVKNFYIKEFWDKISAALTDRVRQKVCDTAINTGFTRAFILLQLAINRLGNRLKVDGKVGPLTLQAAALVNEDKLLFAYSACQAEFYKNIVQKKPSQKKFLNGWLSRAAWLPDKGNL